MYNNKIYILKLFKIYHLYVALQIRELRQSSPMGVLFLYSCVYCVLPISPPVNQFNLYTEVTTNSAGVIDLLYVLRCYKRSQCDTNAHHNFILLADLLPAVFSLIWFLTSSCRWLKNADCDGTAFAWGFWATSSGPKSDLLSVSTFLSSSFPWQIPTDVLLINDTLLFYNRRTGVCRL